MMKKIILISIILIFVGFWFVFKNVMAETSPDGCVSWNFQCVGSLITANLSWNALTQTDINGVRSDCTLSSVSYTVGITDLGTNSVGASTSYSWANLTPKVIYQWKVWANYVCTQSDGYNPRSGSFSTATYSFTTPACDPPIANAGPDKEVFEGQTVKLEGSGSTAGAGCSDYCSEPDGIGGCKPRAAGEYGLPACQRCDGVSLSITKMTGWAEDSEGTNKCTTACTGCNNGNCSSISQGSPDTWGSSTCPDIYGGNRHQRCNGSGSCTAPCGTTPSGCIYGWCGYTCDACCQGGGYCGAAGCWGSSNCSGTDLGGSGYGNSYKCYDYLYEPR